MKKLLFTALFMLAAFVVKAQTVTQAQLQGKWRMATFIDQNGTVDIIKGTWKVNEGVPFKEQVEEMYNDIVLQAQEAVLTIKDNTAMQVVGGHEFGGVYTLDEKDGKTYFHMDKGVTGVPHVFVQDNFMHLSDDDFEMVYVKMQ
jgi:hypothetical protein